MRKMKLPFVSLKKYQSIEAELIKMKDQIRESTDFIKEIEKGNVDLIVSQELEQQELGKCLISMRDHLIRVASEETERNWSNVGLAQFAEILRNGKSLEFRELSNEIMLHLVKYLNANQGAVFILDGENDNRYLELIACYAYERKKFLNKRIEIGEGLVGQCVLEKEPLYLTDLPENYIHITSGLGGANPSVLFICPLVVNERIFGVIEIASFRKFENYQLEFVKRLSESIASTIKNIKDAEKTKSLLNMSQQQEEELRAQEEEMRQNLEEMQATQEEMERKNHEIEKAVAEASSILEGINATMATVEFTPDGIILNANNNFLQATGYGLSDIISRHHKLFMPKDAVDSEEYKTFWTRLSLGQSQAGLFERINSKGELITLNAIYNPIKDHTGKVIKILKFATVVSKQEILSKDKIKV